MQVIKYDWIGAYKLGVKGHPQKVVRELGMEVLDYEAVGIADCSFMEVESVIKELPSYIELSDYKLVKIEH